MFIPDALRVVTVSSNLRFRYDISVGSETGSMDEVEEAKTTAKSEIDIHYTSAVLFH